MSAESLDELRAQRLRQRLWGATIIIALAVIFLPLLLDGSGSESQFRRVERLREEPPRVINVDGSRETVEVPSTGSADQESWWQRTKRRFLEKPPADDRLRQSADSVPDPEPDFDTIGIASPGADPEADRSAGALNDPVTSVVTPIQQNSDIRAWVVQAGGFGDEANALAVRDRLRRAGYPSFVTLSNDGTVFRVRVGPMIDKDQASNVQNSIMELLGRDALVMPYP